MRGECITRCGVRRAHRARFTNQDPAGNNVPGALDRVVSGGVALEPRQPVFGSLRVRHFGPRPLIEDTNVKDHVHAVPER